MATVVKNFRIKSGLIVEGTTGTINGQNILTETGGDSYILNLVGGATLVKSVDTNVFNVDGSGNLTVNANTFDSYGSASAAQTAAEATASADATSKANAAQLAAETTAALDATSKANAAQTAAQSYADGLASNYDAAGSASAAQTAAQSYADGLASNYDAAGAAATAEQNAKDYADDLINDASSSSAEVWSAYKTSTEIGLAQAAAELHADNAVAALVGSAPAVLDTIQELATALENNPDIIADLENVAAGKQDTLTAGSNIDITGSTISVTGLDTADVAEDASRLYFTNQRAIDAVGGSATSDNTPDTVVKRDGNGDFAAGAVTVNRVNIGEAGFIEDDGGDLVIDVVGDDFSVSADDIRLNSVDDILLNSGLTGDISLTSTGGDILLQGPNIYAGENIGFTDAERVATRGYVDTAETDANSYTDGQITNLTDGTNSFQTVNIEDVIAQRAASTTAMGTTQASVFSWDGADYRSAKVLVKVANGVHTQISELMVTLDTANNVGVSEYGITYSNGTELAAISADYSVGMVRILATPANTNTDVTVFATLVI